MSDYNFRQHFRFNKETVTRLTNLLSDDLSHENDRGLPVPPLHPVCIYLSHMGGAEFQRMTRWCGGVSKSTARLCLIHVVNVLVKRKAEFINMQEVDGMHETARRMFDKYKLPRFSMAVDGMQVPFREAPRKIPENKTQQMFWCMSQAILRYQHLDCCQ